MARATPKGEATRERILEAAIGLFERKGYAQTTLREIATEAGCSLGLAYRYFESKDTMVMALYQRLCDECAAEAAKLPGGSLAGRWAQLERLDLARLAPHRHTLSGLFGAGLSPDSPVRVLGPGARPLRQRMQGLFGELIAGSKDAPKAALHPPLTVLFYAGHLLLVLFWLQDPTPGQKATQALIDFGEELLGRLGWLLKLPWAASSLLKLGDLLTPLFGDTTGTLTPEGEST